MVEDRLCSKCGSSGPFPLRGRRCKACIAASVIAWRKSHRSQYNATARTEYADRMAEPEQRATYNQRKKEYHRIYRSSPPRWCVRCGKWLSGRNRKFCPECRGK